MDFLLRSRFLARLPALHPRIRAVSARASQRLHTPRGQAALAGVLAVGFAWVAHERSERAGRRDWLATHVPSGTLLDAALMPRIRMTDPAWLDRAWRNLPTTLATGPEVWRHTELDALVFYLPDAESGLYVPRIYVAAGTQRLTRAWEPLGTGWEGLDRAVQIGNQKEKPQILRPPPSPRRDPRQLNY
jgi:hypothetical protein